MNHESQHIVANRSQYNVFAIAWLKLSHLFEFFSCVKLIAQFGARRGRTIKSSD